MAVDAAIAGGYEKRASLRRVLVAATIGNVLEWFDFLVYGYFAVTIAQVFFPIGNPTVSLLITFAAFGLSYVVRPLGAALIGGYTDRNGRKAGLTLSIGLMMIGTTLMVVTPGYATIGLAAPLIIMLARLLQGFSVGGEFGSAVHSMICGRPVLSERCPANSEQTASTTPPTSVAIKPVEACRCSVLTA